MRLVISDCIEEIVQTPHGPILVAVSGNRHKKAILTYHDFGLNCESIFRGHLVEYYKAAFNLSLEYHSFREQFTFRNCRVNVICENIILQRTIQPMPAQDS